MSYTRPETPLELDFYRSRDGRVPYNEWLFGLDDDVSGKIAVYVHRVRTANFGNSRSVGNGVLELKINIGPGFRVYYIKHGRTLVVLLCGGDKKSQGSDIRRASRFADDYRSRP